MLSWSNSDLLSQPCHRIYMTHKSTQASHLWAVPRLDFSLISWIESAHSWSCLHQPLIWSQPTAASPACPNLMIITNPHASFLSTKIWHWYLTSNFLCSQNFSPFERFTASKCWERMIIICTSSRCKYTRKTGGLQRGASSQSNSSHSGPAVQIGALVSPGFTCRLSATPG